MARPRRISFALLASALAAIVSPPTHAGDGPERVVYVESNIGTSPGLNSIFAFRLGDDDRLRPIPGSPFPTAGTGVGPTLALGPYDSDQNLITDRRGRRLFAVNSGSNTIAVFDIREGGRLEPVMGSPFPSGGVNPVSVGLADDILCVVNKNMDPNQDESRSLPNYTTLRVNPRGRLIPVPFAAVEVGQGTSPTQALVPPSSRLLFGADFFGGLLQSFEIRPNGRLRQNPPMALPESEFVGDGAGAPRFPLGLASHPEEPIVYVGFVTINRLGVYTYDRWGRLEFVRSVPSAGIAICWLIANADGSRLYATNTGDGSVSVFDTTDPLDPVEIQKVTLAGQPNSPFQIVLDRRGAYAYVVTQRATPAETAEANALHVLRVDGDGLLEQVDRVVLPVPEGARPQGVVAF